MQYQSSPFPIRKPLVVAIQNVFLGITACCTVLYPVGMAYAGTSETSAAFTATQVVRQFTLRNTVVQANEALQAQVADVSGTLKGAAMATYGVLAADMGTVPSGIGVPQRDGAGRALGYCAWDNTNASGNSSYLGGSGASVPLVYAVVSAGLNGAIETSCAYILANRTALGDDYVQVRLPAKVSATTFKTAVSTLSALPAGTEGDIRLVLDTNMLYSYTGSAWAPVKSTGSFAEDGSGNLSYALGKVTVAAFEASTATFSGNVSVGGATTLTGALTANNGITVSSGGASITGNTNITGTLNVGSNTTVTGTVTATGFSGNGSTLTNLNANNISSGTLGVARGGTGVDASAAANGQLLIGNGTGFTLANLTGTANQVVVGNSAGGIALSLPQNIATASTPTFGGMTLNGVLTGTTATLSGNVTANRLLLGDSTGGVITANIVIGNGAMNASPSGAGANTAVGVRTLMSNTSGQNNVALGTDTLLSNTTGSRNTALGAYSMGNNTTGTDNIAVGEGSLFSTTTGSSNTVVGSVALFSNLTGYENTGLGRAALVNSTGSGNSATGNLALSQIVSGDNNTALGNFTGTRDSTRYLTSGSYNTLLGAWSGPSAGVSSLSYATAIGSYAEVGTSNTVVLGRTTDSTVIGATGTASSGVLSGKILQVTGDVGVNGTLYATGLNISGSTSFNSLALTGALTGTTATFSGAVSGNSFAGNGSALTALNASNISSGTLGVARGGTGVDASAAANGQLLIGNGTGFTLANLTGTANQVTVTNSAGGITLSLPQNIATTSTPTFGGLTISGRINITDSTGVSNANVIIGTSAMAAAQSGTGANTAVGSSALNANTSGSNNVAVGRRVLLVNTSGSQNLGLGSESLLANTTGGSNVGLGYRALDTNTTGSNNTALGHNADTSGAALTYATVLGSDAVVATSSTVVLGRASDTVVIGATGTASSGTLLNRKLQVTGDIGVAGRLIALDTSGGLTVGNVVVGSGNFTGSQTGYGASIALGVNSLAANTSGYRNIAIGEGAMYSNTTGLVNTAVGGNALYSNTIAGANAAFGYRSLESVTSGDYNAAFGAFALDGLVSGNQNVGVGVDAGSFFSDANFLLTNGSNNTFLGSSSSPASGVHTLNYATVVGSEARVGTNNTVVLGRTTDTTVIGATGTASSGVLSGKILQVTGNVGVTGTVTTTAGVLTTSDRRMKTDFSQLGDDLLNKLSGVNAYQYRYISDSTGKFRYGVIAQEVQALFPNAVMTDSSGYLSVDYGALGAIAAAGVGKLNKQFIALNNTVTEQGKQLSTLETKVNSMDERVLALEGWRVTATTRMDSMQKAIDLNIEKIAEHALKIAANEEKLTKLESVVGKIDERVVGTESRLDKVEGRWSSTFSVSEDGQVLTVQASHLVASNFTAQQLKAKVAYTERLEAEMARIRELEVNNLKANTASAQTLQAGSVQAATVNTGSLQVFVSAGLPAFLFSAPEDGHYTVNTSASDGSYASASVIVNMGQVKVVTFKSEGIELIGDGNAVKVLSNGKMIRASWTKTG